MQHGGGCRSRRHRTQLEHVGQRMGCEPKGCEPERHEPRGFDPKGCEPKRCGPRQHGSKGHSPWGHNRRQHGPRGHSREGHNPKGHNPKGHNLWGYSPAPRYSRRRPDARTPHAEPAGSPQARPGLDHTVAELTQRHGRRPGNARILADRDDPLGRNHVRDGARHPTRAGCRPL